MATSFDTGAYATAYIALTIVLMVVFVAVFVSELSWKHIDHPSEVVEVGNEVTVDGTYFFFLDNFLIFFFF